MWRLTWNLQYYREYSRERESWDGRSAGFNKERDVGVRPGRPVGGSDRARQVGRRWAGLLGSRERAGTAGRWVVEKPGLLVWCRSVRELGEKWFWGEMVLVYNTGAGLWESWERNCFSQWFCSAGFEGKRKGGEWFLFSTTRDFGFNFFLIKCHCHVGKWLMKDGQKAPL